MTSKREFYPFYIGPNEDDINQMLQKIGKNSLDQVFDHLPTDVLFTDFNFDQHLEREELQSHLKDIASKNKQNTSFLGDGLFQYKQMPVVAEVCNIRGLTTAYTPYQPERSQGTLQTLWIYQNLLAKITGFRAINASLYERSTCLYEALNCAVRIHRKSNKVLVSSAIFPGDIEVLETLKQDTNLQIDFIEINHKTGKLDKELLTKKLQQNTYAGVAIPHINSFGVIEDIDELTTIINNASALVIAIAEITALSNNGLKEPSKWGLENEGADILVAEGQHLTLSPNFGGPGLGVFGIRHDLKTKSYIRSTAGRFIGKTTDVLGNECKTIVLSTREQHIRREKATSNICSNQSFIATACGAALLTKGSVGFENTFSVVQKNIKQLINELTCLKGVDLLFQGPFYNQFTLKLNQDVSKLISLALEENLAIGHDISHRNNMGENLLLIATSDIHGPHELQKLINFFNKNFEKESISNTFKDIDTDQKRFENFYFKDFSQQEVVDYYKKLGELNFSPDTGIYPLGSCTMKYNPEINDWAASLEGFTQTHPQTCESQVQGNLEVLYYIQEAFKKITGLPAVTTQPVAGAQGELVGIKMFQAYFKDLGEAETRNIILIPKTAHGTNPATATMAGFDTKVVDGVRYGIVEIEAGPNGQIDLEKFTEQVQLYNKRIVGCMITNPNTSGIFEKDFKQISELIHEVGGLVYMDGANMNAIAGWVDLKKLGVDAVHNNLHKTWSIPHGGGGPGDAIVAVSEKLIDYLPGKQIILENNFYKFQTPSKTIGSFHRHHGNFAHKVRAYTYLMALGEQGIRQMSAVAVLNARYLYDNLKEVLPSLPFDQQNPRMHEFILTLSEDMFNQIQKSGTPKAQIIPKVGKLFLDFGFHAPTVAFPEIFGLMFEPTESYTKAELDEFIDIVKTISNILKESPELLQTAPHFSPVKKVDELKANKELILFEDITDELTSIKDHGISLDNIKKMQPSEIIKEIFKEHSKQISTNN